MSFFAEVEGEAAVLVESGIYRQVPLYVRDGFLYAKTGSGFVKLMAGVSTTKSKLRLDFMTWTGPLAKDGMGRLCSPDVTGSKLIGGAA